MLRSKVLGFSSCVIFFALVVLSACSRQTELNSVQGKVLYKDSPLAGATVTFLPRSGREGGGDWPVGETKEDGTFTVSTGGTPGAAAGEYDVTIVCMETPAASKGPKSGGLSTGGLEPVDKLRGAYADPARSKLSVQIKEGANTLEPFVLK